MRLGEATWNEVDTATKLMADDDGTLSPIVLIPVGSTEQHGPHLPLNTDTLVAEEIAGRALHRTTGLMLGPTISITASGEHAGFPGTLSIGTQVMGDVAIELGRSADWAAGIVFVNGHGGNAPALHLAAQMINRDAHIFTCVDTGESSDADVHELLDAPNDVHAGEIETSTTLAIRPHLVDMKKAPRTVPKFSSRYLDFTSKRSVGWYAYTEKISPNGVMGDATKATVEKGNRIWELMTDRLVELVEDLKKLSLDEIHQRRY